MDDTEHVCPLCCEELDLSDQQFYPCKCGYQVCMWCWHRIRESESGLCPACRTPYGDDPHEFSAVDVEEVLKANREKEAAAKRERERQRQQGSQSEGIPLEAVQSTHGDDGGAGLTGIMAVPKDRNQLANMRVIRRNLVYAVGLPPSISNEDTLNKPEYFGQYGKVSKIVLNRSQATNGDPRRASCSAYVTFVHKEDTLACILALDGFYLENRNIRASYGTSKYCSAFIKNVRCNNPECTYLHEMGAVEDTFTKQEIQAGYVTSGRDVLARQQQIVQQALSASSQATSGTAPRRRVGGGGPSGTGKASSNPVFPPPEYDEPTKPAPTLVPPPQGVSRAASTGTGFPTVAGAAEVATKPMSRSASVGATTKPAGAVPAAARKANGTAASAAAAAPQGATAASVVASGRPASGDPSAHSGPTLTPLTPLKRASKGSATASKPAAASANPLNNPEQFPKPTRPQESEPAKKPGKGKKKQQQQNDTTGSANGSAAAASGASSSPVLTSSGPSSSNSALAELNETADDQPVSLSALGGEVIAAPGIAKPPPNVGAIGSPSVRGNQSLGSAALNGVENGNDMLGATPGGLSGLGGEVFEGPLNPPSGKSAIGSGKDKWSSSQYRGSGALGGSSSQGFENGGQPIGGLWNGSNMHSNGNMGTPIGGGSGGVIGGHVTNNNGFAGGGNPFGPGPGGRNAGSSALASILGINLPQGAGGESSSLWPGQQQQQQQQQQQGQHRQPAPVSLLNGAPVPSQGVIGRSSGSGSSGLIGGVPIGGNPIGSGGGMNNQGPIGGSNKNDIALLQSLLPEVHITSGHGAGPNGWNSVQHHQQPVGAIGRNTSQQAQRQGTAGNIW